MTWLRWCFLPVWLALGTSPAAAQALEGVLMPGKVIAGHAKYEAECSNCHVKFDRAAQDGLCRDCHKPVGADVAAKRGYHGRLEGKACRSCHTDHKGRDVNIVALDERSFDHTKTDYVLRGAHLRSECRACHVAGKKHREASSECNDCHRKDDKHRGALGPRCAECHTEANWKEARFDHSRTRFALTGKHVPATCKSCHADNVFKGAPLTCAGCHRKDDKQHRGRLGEKCEACHNAADWKDTAAFRHDRDTRFALRGKHAPAKCESCHTVTPGLAKTPTTCIGCHQKDDKHNATLGTVCGDCHTERNWRETRYDHDLSVFRLRGKHKDVECKDCHRDPKSFKGTAQTCIACHRKDDKHKSRYGDRCDGCHTDKSWRDIVFRHERDTKYPLLGKHAATRCDSCHVGHVYQDKLKTDCHSCHRKDDKHREQLGRQCEQCHETADWKQSVRFDHNKSRFQLVGRHARVECRECHLTPAYKDAKSECAACHAKDDKHKLTLGSDCAQCHNARDWRVWDYNHDRRTRFTLEGAHRPLACGACHRLPGEKIPAVGRECVACHRGDDIHHGEYGAACERCHTTRNFREIKGLGGTSLSVPTEARQGATTGARP